MLDENNLKKKAMESDQEKDLITLALRFIHVVLNSIMVFIGVVSIGYGAIIFYHSIIKANENIFFTPLTIFSIMVIAIGSAFVFISTLGCCVNICESFGLTISYVVSLLIVFVLLVAGMIYNGRLEVSVADFIDRARASEEPQMKTLLHAIQNTFYCCCSNSSQDYGILAKYCNSPYYKDGCDDCHSRMIQGAVVYTPNVKYCGIGFILFDVICIVITSCMAARMRNLMARKQTKQVDIHELTH